MKSFIFLSVFFMIAFSTFAQNVGIGTDTPTAKLDVRGSTRDDGVTIQVGNSDLTHLLMFFGGRETDPNPFIYWHEGDPLRFCTDYDGNAYQTLNLRTQVWMAENLRVTHYRKDGMYQLKQK